MAQMKKTYHFSSMVGMTANYLIGAIDFAYTTIDEE